VAGAPDPLDLEAIAVGVMRLSRVFDRLRSHLLENADNIVDYTDMVLLFTLVKQGPMRASALATAVHSDASTISRQAASLVGRGLIERHADATDGRVSVLVATDEARQLVAVKSEARDEHFGQVLSDWSTAEIRAFAPLLTRLAADLEGHWHDVMTGTSTTDTTRKVPR
jgi:DNA-binding MarR family transcriptional regulator